MLKNSDSNGVGGKSRQDRFMKDDYVRNAFEDYRRTEYFCECAEVGSEAKIKQMKELLDTDPRRFMRATTDPDHVLNKKNSRGCTPLYLAAKNGNINVVKLLIERQADPLIYSELGQGIRERPLQAAVRWGHALVVEHLLETVVYPQTEIKEALKLANEKQMRKLVLKYVRGKGSGFLPFLCCSQTILSSGKSLCYSRATLNRHKLLVCAPAQACLLYTSPSPRDGLLSRMPSSA
eukprot:TRINITY_DN6180_c0_g1_i3.p2 TRINITY_DN6180_c0_g1~~TRINITY_DN6180_c0_g1_i3.p2  ORF type:complete len:235 (-),score=21.17 TRINITY_DN6180_c0_g1_i3:36-740(-)